jgi:hypothetical protein
MITIDFILDNDSSMDVLEQGELVRVRTRPRVWGLQKFAVSRLEPNWRGNEILVAHVGCGVQY